MNNNSFAIIIHNLFFFENWRIQTNPLFQVFSFFEFFLSVFCVLSVYEHNLSNIFILNCSRDFFLKTSEIKAVTSFLAANEKYLL